MNVHALSESASFDALLARHRNRDVLRFITCGSVDDGKSTLIGRLLHDSKQLFDDQIVTLEADSRRHGTQGDALDFALLVDGLSAEREQGITIDVAYRFFATDKRAFIVADTPGHEQYTRNMATGASTADLAVLLIDARRGLTQQTRRHSLLISMLGIKQVILAINKMDLVDWSEDTYKALKEQFETLSEGLNFTAVSAIPMSALKGENVVEHGSGADWYSGPTLIEALETAEAGRKADDSPFRMPVQWVSRPDSEFRGYAGLITSGSIGIGDSIALQPSGGRATVRGIKTFDGDLLRASAGQSVTLTFAEEVDVSRGDIVASAELAPLARDRFRARLFWSSDAPAEAGSAFLLKLGTATAGAQIHVIHARTDPATMEAGPANRLRTNDIADVTLRLDRKLAFDTFDRVRDTGNFILIDRESADTAAMGLVTAPVEDVAPIRSGEHESVRSPEPKQVGAASTPARDAQWRLIGSAMTFGIALAVTQNLQTAAVIAALEFGAKSAFLWARDGLWLRHQP